ncbi:hemolysin [Candidatus Magnetoovum chiemensis]|nr:hemolysin [Candidatus Magnetoovum chiemensis]
MIENEVFKLNMKDKKFLSKFEITIEKILALHQLDELYKKAINSPDSRPFTEKALDVMNIQYEISKQDLLHIPRSGPVIVVANHPYGMIEGIILASIMMSVREDFKILANHILYRIPEMRKYLIFADPFGTSQSVRLNYKTIKESLQLLNGGGMLAVFPAGEVSHIDLQKRKITDPQWNDTIARLIRKTGASVVPVYFKGVNNVFFQLFGMLHPRLRTLMLPRQLLNKSDKKLNVCVGKQIPSDKLTKFTLDKDMIDYLRLKTYILENRFKDDKEKNNLIKKLYRHKLRNNDNLRNNVEPIIESVNNEVMSIEIKGLPEHQCLLTSKDYMVMYAKASQIPNVLREIGRLREITFRETGEGTGKAVDLDRYDEYYYHLFIWNKEKKEIVGAYRLGPTDEILTERGKAGLYTSSLFRYKIKLLNQINPALEMGRSFVRPEYQKVYSSLLLLWKGIGHFVVRNPQYKILFGPVSINNEYRSISQQLLVNFLKMNRYRQDLAKFVKPYIPYRAKKIRGLKPKEKKLVLNDIDEVSNLISDIEEDYKGVPVLLRQYLKLGGQLLGFNVDPSFSNVLDGLILVDLLKSDYKVLERYLTEEGLKSFLVYHNRAAE